LRASPPRTVARAFLGELPEIRILSIFDLSPLVFRKNGGVFSVNKGGSLLANILGQGSSSSPLHSHRTHLKSLYFEKALLFTFWFVVKKQGELYT
jgi:hypothetical protein